MSSTPQVALPTKEKGAGNFLSRLLLALGIGWVILAGGCAVFGGFIAAIVTGEALASHLSYLILGVVLFSLFSIVCMAPGWILILISLGYLANRRRM